MSKKMRINPLTSIFLSLDHNSLGNVFLRMDNSFEGVMAQVQPRKLTIK